MKHGEVAFAWMQKMAYDLDATVSIRYNGLMDSFEVRATGFVPKIGCAYSVCRNFGIQQLEALNDEGVVQVYNNVFEEMYNELKKREESIIG